MGESFNHFGKKSKMVKTEVTAEICFIASFKQTGTVFMDVSYIMFLILTIKI